MKSRWNMHSNLRLRFNISNNSTRIIQCKTTAAANELQNLKLKLAESRDEQKMTIVDVARSKKAWKTLCWNWNFITDQMYQVMFFSYPFTVKISTWWSVSAASTGDIECFSPLPQVSLTGTDDNSSFAFVCFILVRLNSLEKRIRYQNNKHIFFIAKVEICRFFHSFCKW